MLCALPPVTNPSCSALIPPLSASLLRCISPQLLGVQLPSFPLPFSNVPPAWLHGCSWVQCPPPTPTLCQRGGKIPPLLHVLFDKSAEELHHEFYALPALELLLLQQQNQILKILLASQWLWQQIQQSSRKSAATCQSFMQVQQSMSKPDRERWHSACVPRVTYVHLKGQSLSHLSHLHLV